MDSIAVRKSLEPGGDRVVRSTGLSLSRDVVRELSRLRTGRGVAQIALEWSALVGAAVLCHIYFHPLLYLATVIWIGTRQHALGILLHDGVHNRIARDRRWNYWLTELLLAWPLYLTFHGYQREHFAHHRWVGTDRDPDWLRTRYPDYEFPKTRRQLQLGFLKHLVGMKTIRDFYNMLIVAKLSWDVPLGVNIGRGLYYAVLFATLAHFDLLLAYLMYWVVPVCTVLVFILYLRLVAEHSGLGPDAYMMSRNVYPSPVEKLLISPNNVNFHLDHHLYPSVPFYNLPQLHRELLADPHYRSNARNTRGYFSGLIQECVTCEPAEIMQVGDVAEATPQVPRGAHQRPDADRVTTDTSPATGHREQAMV